MSIGWISSSFLAYENEPSKVKELESRYDEILNKAAEEYEYEPPSKYYKDGYNLYLRLRKYKKITFCFYMTGVSHTRTH